MNFTRQVLPKWCSDKKYYLNTEILELNHTMGCWHKRLTLDLYFSCIYFLLKCLLYLFPPFSKSFVFSKAGSKKKKNFFYKYIQIKRKQTRTIKTTIIFYTYLHFSRICFLLHCYIVFIIQNPTKAFCRSFCSQMCSAKKNNNTWINKINK